MLKRYLCRKCGVECKSPVYLRLVATKCGLVQVRQRLSERTLKRHLAIPVGHFCAVCLSVYVRTILDDDTATEKLAGFLGS